MPVHLKSSLVKEELTATAWERDAAPESPMLFPLNSAQLRRSCLQDPRDAEPEVPIKLLLKSKFLKEELTAGAWERDAAPQSPTLFPLKSNLVKDELSARTSERDPAPEVPIKLLLKSKFVKELTARAWERDAYQELVYCTGSNSSKQ